MNAPPLAALLSELDLRLCHALHDRAAPELATAREGVAAIFAALRLERVAVAADLADDGYARAADLLDSAATVALCSTAPRDGAVRQQIREGHSIASHALASARSLLHGAA